MWLRLQRQAGRVWRMREILAAAAFGFAKGLFAGRANPDAQLGGPHWTAHSLMGPLYEETLYRALPLYLGGAYAKLPVGWTAVPFALEHVVQENNRGLHQTTASAFARFTDVFLGGLLYEKAFRRWGILGAFAAHAAHNAMTTAGLHASRRVRRPAEL